ncbi:MAG: GreA/GreB family elongation factor [Solirubrobacterales bacterium]
MAQGIEDHLAYGAAWPAVSGVEPQSPQTRAIITREGERALRASVQRLRHQLDVEFAARLNEARGFGEIGGNDDYLQTIEEQAVLASRLSRLQRLLDSATVVEQQSSDGGAAAVGTIVEVKDLASGAIHEHRLIGDYETLVANAVSASSPVGRALIGKSPGDEVEVALPHGRAQGLRVLKVRAAGSRVGFASGSAPTGC